MNAYFTTQLIMTDAQQSMISKAAKAYANAFTYYSSDRGTKKMSSTEFRSQNHFEDVAAKIIQSAVYMALHGHDCYTEDHFSFPQPKITRRGTITLPKIGSLQTADPLPTFADPKYAVVFSNGAISLKYQIGTVKPPYLLQVGNRIFESYAEAYKFWKNGHGQSRVMIIAKTNEVSILE